MNPFVTKTANPDAYYEPNSFGGAAEDPSVAEPPLKLSGDADRFNHRDGNDDYTQPGALYRLLGADQQGRLHRNIAEAMAGAPEDIVERMCVHFDKADPAYGDGVRRARAELMTVASAAE